MKVEPVLAKLNELRKDASGSGDLEETALYHAFCFISYEVGPFTEFVEKGVDPLGKKRKAPGPRARDLFAALEGLRDEVSGDEGDMEFVALDRAVDFLSRTLGDFQAYLDEVGQGA